MLNILRMENYRLLRSRYPKMILLVVLVVVIGMLFFSDILLPKVGESMQEDIQAQAGQAGTQEQVDLVPRELTDGQQNPEDSSPISLDLNFEMGMDDANEILHYDSLLEGFFNFIKPSSAPIFLIIGLFTAIFISENYKTGFAKNYVGNFTDRGHIIFAQYLSALIFTFGTLLIVFVTFILFKVFITSDTVPFGNFPESLPAIAGQLLSYAAFVAMIFLVYYLTRSQAQTIIFAVLYSIDVISQILRVLELALKSFLKLDVSLADKLLGVRMSDLSFLDNPADIMTLAIYAFFIICVSLGLSSLKFQRSDIH